MIQKFNLQNKVAVITGGAGVLGGSIAKSLSSSGVKIVILDRNQEAINAKVAEINSTGGEAIGFETNVLDKATLEKNRNDILQAFLIQTENRSIVFRNQMAVRIDFHRGDSKIQLYTEYLIIL